MVPISGKLMYKYSESEFTVCYFIILAHGRNYSFSAFTGHYFFFFAAYQDRNIALAKKKVPTLLLIFKSLSSPGETYW